MSMQCLIVDDEPLAHDVILQYARDLPDLEIAGQCYLATEALAFLNRHPVDLIFLDIRMPRISGLDFLRTLQHRPLVIITSAHEEHALESYELEVCDYLLKPFRFDRFLKAVNRAQEMLRLRNEDNRYKQRLPDKGITPELPQPQDPVQDQREASPGARHPLTAPLISPGEISPEPPQHPDDKKPVPKRTPGGGQSPGAKQGVPDGTVDHQHLFVKSDRRWIQLELREVQYLESLGNYVKIWESERFILTPRTLSGFEESLPPEQFIRIHKSFILNRRFVRSIEGNVIRLKSGKELPLGKNYKHVVKQLMM